jgi:hypothetical protein
MADITQAIEQDQIAESLLGDPQPTEYEQEESGEQGGQEQVDDWQQITDELRGETQRIQGQPAEQQEQESEPAELTPQAIEEGTQQLGQMVEQLGLNDSAEATLLATSLGVEPARAAPLGAVMAKTALSALSIWEYCGGDISKAGPIPRESAVAFAREFLPCIGIDPRMSQANPEQLATVVMQGALSFIQAVSAHGVNAGLDRLNSPEASEWFANSLLRCFGQSGCDRQAALQLADASGRYLLSVFKKLEAQRSQEQPRQGRQSQARRSGGARQRSSGRSAFRTNSDIFDSEAMEEYRLHHGRL